MLKSKSSLQKDNSEGKFFLKWPFLIFLTVVIASITIFFKELRKISNQPIQSWTEEVSADCGVVLTGGANRVKEGFDLLSRGQIKKLILSGVYANAQLREIFPQWPFYGEVREKDVILDRRSGTTYGNAQQTLPIVEAIGCRDLVLVTSNSHMYRAQKTFKAIYPTTIPIYPLAVVASRAESTWYELSTEVLKSMFYSLWAY